MKRIACLPLAALMLMVVACGERSTTLSADAYVHSSAAIADDYQARMDKLSRRELPAKATAEERRKHSAAEARLVATEIDGPAGKLAALKPPKEMEGLHLAYLNFYEGQSERFRAWADAIERDDPNAAAVGNEIDKFLLDATRRVITEIEATAGTQPALREQLRSLEKQLGVNP